MRAYQTLRAVIACGILWAVLELPAPALGPDWRMYRGDARRSGYTSEPLTEELALRWSYRARHAPQPAWSGRDTRMPFDRALRTVIHNDTLFFASSVDCKVYALDADTGAERWSFFTGGPVRFAPAVWRERVFVVSDDGHLYCLAMGNGRLLWKLRGGPEDSMVLGNDRITSRWPARGGPVIADRVVYWAAGIWPSEGIFVYAVDATTGKVIWCNDSSGGITMAQPHPTAVAQSGVSAQGDLVVAGDTLLVPTGRAVPAAFRRSDGELLYFHLQKFGHAGGSNALSFGAYHLSSGMIFDTETGLQACAAGADAAAAVVTPTHLVLATRAGIVAIDPANPWVQKESVNAQGVKTTALALAKPAWQMPAPHAVTMMVGAGDSLVVGGDNKVSVVHIPSQRVTFTTTVEGEPCGVASASGRLFVSTDKGWIYCFGSGSGKPGTIEPVPAVSPYPERDAYARAAEEIIRRTGVTQGYCLDAACGDGALAYALAKRTRLRICAIDVDPEKVALARQKLDAAGIYGSRVTVFQGEPSRFPGMVANLVVAGRSVVDEASAPPAGEIERLTRPYGGKACLGRPGAMVATTRGEPAGAGDWTHQYCDPANTNCSTDALVRGPLGVLWFTDLNYQMPSRHGRGPAPLFYKGVLLIEGMHAVRGVDAYNGRVLWDYPLPEVLKIYDGEHLMGVSGTGSNLCVGPHGLFVRAGHRCLRIDPMTGKLLGAFPAPATRGRPGEWGYIACAGDALIGTLSNPGHMVTYRYRPGIMAGQWTESGTLFAMDAQTGAIRWRWRPKHSIRHNTLAIGAGRVYVIDRPTAESDRKDEAKRGTPDKGFTHPPGALVALNLADGKEVWRSEEEIYGTMLALSEEHGVLVMCYQPTAFKLASEIGGRMAGIDAATGRRRWDVEATYKARPILNGRTIYLQPGAWDLLTGAPLEFKLSRSYGCGIPAGSKNMLLFRSATLGYVDLRDGRGTENYGGIRPGCWINVLPVGGLVLMPDATDRCTCSYLIKASVALQPMDARPAGGPGAN